MKITQELTLDTSRENAYKVVHAKQYDEDSRFLKVTITTRGEEIEVPSGATVVFSVKRADLESHDFAGVVNADGTVTVPLTNWMLQVAGKCVCDVSIIKDSEKFSTLNFSVLVEYAPTNETDITEDEGYDVLVSLVERVEGVVDHIDELDQRIAEAENSATSAAGSAERASEALLNAQDQIKAAQELADKAEGSATNAKTYADQAKRYRDEFADTIEQVAEAKGEYDSLDSRITAMQTEIEGGVPKDIEVRETEDGKELLVLVDAEGEPIGEGTELPDSGAMALESATVTVGDAEMVEVWLKDKNGEKIEGSETRFAAGSGSGGGGGGSTTITVERITPSPLIITPTDSAKIEFNFSSVDSDGQTVDGYYTWKVGSKILESGTLNQGYNSFDAEKLLGQDLPVGTTKFSLTVNDDAGSMLTRIWNVQVVDIRLEPSDANLAKKTYAVGESVLFNYVPYGAVEKTIHFKVDGTEVGTTVTSVSGNSQRYTIPAQAHGAHLFECYITASISGKNVETEHIYYDLVWFDEDAGTPVIGCVYRNDLYGAITLKQFNTMIIPFYVADPDTSTPTITKEIDGEVVAEETLEGSEGEWSVKLTEVGEHTLIIRCGVTYVEIVINTTDIGFDVETVEGYVFDFNPVGHTNTSANRLWVEESNPAISMSVSPNFDWQNGGYQIGRDEDGNAIPGEEYFCIKSGTYATINYKMFAKDAKGSGAAFKVIFKTTNVRKSDAQFLTCSNGLSDDKAGLVMNVHEAYVRTNADELYIPYSEEDAIEFEYNIYPIGEGEDVTSYIMTYEDGVGLRPLLYDNNHVIKQYEPAEIVIGSPDCDVYIYRMRAYEINLTDSDILQNFITDARTSDEMVSRHDRNEIYDENGNLTPELLAQKCPDLRIIKVEAPWFTNDKDNKIDGTTVQMIYKNGDPVLDNWTCTDARHSGQGTSSNEYGYAGRNLDLIMDGDESLFTFSDGTTGKTITLTRDSVPTDYLNVKVNIASSENANNALMANRYNTFNPYKRTAKIADSKVKDSMEFHNCVVFIRETDEDLTTHREFNDTNWHFYAFGNVGDSKKTDDTRVDDKTDPKECVIEITDYNVRLAEFPTGYGDAICTPANWKAGNTAYDDLYAEYKYKEGKFKSFGNGSYEFRYEKKGITDEERQANIDAWRDFYKFVVTSTDKEFHDNLGNYFVVDSALYYYLFTERYTMVDNRAKNSFWHYGKGADGVYRWDLTFGYDFDTCLGIDNTGKLVLPYGKEDVDYYVDGDPSSSYIYRAAESKFFCRIRDLFKTELEAMYLNREDVNAWSASGLITQWDNSQNQFPEELWRLDIERKYLRTYKGVSIDNSIVGAANPRFFREMMNGRKRYQRRQFERNQEIYFATKYFGKTATADQIMLRFNNPVSAVVAKDFTLYLTPYSDMYIGFSFYNGHKDNVRAKAGVEYTINYPEGLEAADITLIYGASFIQGIGDLSKCYVGDNDFSKASRLQSLVIGSTAEGYANTFMTTLSLGNNKLLEYLDIRNMTGLNSIVDLTKCYNLLELYAEGSSISGVAFAKNGKVTTAHLPNTVNTLRMQNLQNLTDFQMSTDSLQHLTIEHCLIDEKRMVEESVDTLRTLTLAGIDWTGDNALATTELLNDLFDLNESSLSGQVYISGQVRSQELANYEDAWHGLTVRYNAANLIEQYKVTYVDDTGSELYSYYVDRGQTPVDPVSAGYIETPTKTSTSQYTYTFASWNELTSPVLEARVVTAVFTATVRTYTVAWYDAEGGLKLDEQVVEYGSDAVYAGETPANEFDTSVYSGKMFTGWDKSTGYIRGDMSVYAVWSVANLPSAGTKDLSEMSTAELYAVSAAATNGLANVEEYFSDKDYHDITMGTDFNFANVESKEIVSIDAPRILDGSTAIDTDVYLFGDQEKSFTMAIDFTFACNSDDTNATLVSAFEEEGSEGFRLRFNSYPSIQWGDKSQIVGNYVSSKHYRDIVVIRHRAGENNLYVYSGCQSSNGSGARFADTITRSLLARTRQTATNVPITLGAVRFPDGGYDYYGKGVIHWCKVWYDDLGETNAYELASWCREPLRMEFCGTGRYRLAGTGTSAKAKISFIANNLLTGRGYWMNDTNTNAGGWDASLMRTFCNTRLLNALPLEWRNIIKTVKISASAGDQSTEILISEDKIYLAANTELGGYTSDPYGNEGTPISWFTSYKSRLKFRGRMVEDDAVFYTAADDPSLDTANNVKEGDIWINTSKDSIGYMYLTQAELDKYNLTPEFTASIGGGWIIASYWWERSPNASGSTGFIYVTIHGYASYASYASGVLGVCPCFSI